MLKEKDGVYIMNRTTLYEEPVNTTQIEMIVYACNFRQWLQGLSEHTQDEAVSEFSRNMNILVFGFDFPGQDDIFRNIIVDLVENRVGSLQAFVQHICIFTPLVEMFRRIRF